MSIQPPPRLGSRFGSNTGGGALNPPLPLTQALGSTGKYKKHSQVFLRSHWPESLRSSRGLLDLSLNAVEGSGDPPMTPLPLPEGTLKSPSKLFAW